MRNLWLTKLVFIYICIFSFSVGFSKEITIIGSMSDCDISLGFNVSLNQIDEADNFTFSSSIDLKDIYTDHNSDSLLHPEWGFDDFVADTEYPVSDLNLSNIQQAIDNASAAGGGTVVLSPGSVTINNRINMKSNVKLKGVLNTDSSLAVTIIAGGQFSEGLIYANTSIQNTTIENLILDVNNEHMHCIAYVYGPDNFLVNNNEMKNVGTPKINTVSGENDVPGYMDNPTGVNIWSDGNFAENFTISNNIIDGVAKHGIDINNGRYFILQNNYIRNAFMGFDASTGSQYAEIIGNETYGCIFGAKIIGASSNDVIIHHNNIHHCDPSPYFWGGEWGYDSGTALVLQMPGTNIVVHYNILSGATSDKGIAYWDGGKGDVQNNDFTPSTWTPDSAAPQITLQPESQIKTVGSQATFSIIASGTDTLNYQWYLSGALINGAENSEYTTSTLSEENSGEEYYCVVSNSLGNDTSNIAFLIVNPAGSGIMHGGKLNKGTNAEGGYYPWECDGGACKRGLLFNATSSFLLKSVKVYNGEINDGSSYSGYRAITVINASGHVVADTTVNIVIGEQRLELNLPIPTGDNYRILSDVRKGFWRDNAVSYPYAIGTYGSIIAGADSLGSDAGNGGYYFFYDWIVKDIYLSDIKETSNEFSENYSLEQNYPNPFNHVTVIYYTLPKASHISLSVYNSIGQELVDLVNQEMKAGKHQVSFNASSLSNGMYYYSLKADGLKATKKMMVLK